MSSFSGLIDTIHWCFIPEVRKYPASKALLFKVLLILGNALGYSEPHKFKCWSQVVEAICLLPNTTSLIQPQLSGDHKDVQGSLQSYGKDCRCHEDNPNRKDGMKVWKNYTTDDATVVTEKAVKAIKPETTNPCQRKLCPEVVRDFTGFMIELIKEITETEDMAKN